MLAPKLFISAAVVILALPLAFSQQTITSATLGGRVEDSSGAPLAGITVSARLVERGQTQQALTDSQGRYQFLSLPIGAYKLTVEDSRFQPFYRTFTLVVGQAADLPITLPLAAMNETIQVNEAAIDIEAARTQVSDYVSPREIDSLPLNGRNYLDLALLAPGVSRTNTGTPQQFAETSAVPGTGLSVAGQRNLNNSFIVDGVSANDDAAGLAGTFLGQEVIREFQVITAGGSAEFGRASSGVLNVATKSGGNEWHGGLYGFLRDGALDARNPLAVRKDSLTQTQYGATLGGPIQHNRTFLFSNFEQTRRQAAGYITIQPSQVDVINRTLDVDGYRAPRITTGAFPTGYDSTAFFARMDHEISAGQQLMVRYNLYDISSPNSRSVGGLSDVSRGTRLDNRDQTIAATETATLSPRAMNELRVQFTRSRLSAPANDLTGPAVNISGAANFGTSTSSPTGRDTDLYELSDSVSAQRGSHFLKAGVDFLYNRVNIVFPGALQGVYTFSSVANFQAGRYATFQQAFGAPNQFQSNPNLGGFVEDEWKPRANLTVHVGLRYDVERLPKPIRSDTNNIAPRFGIAYSPGDRRTVIRASYGLFYDRIPLRATSNALQRDGSKYRVALVSFGQAGAPVFPAQLSDFPTNQTINISTIDPKIGASYSHQASFQVEREVVRTVFVTAGYQWTRGLHLILSRNVNVPTLTAADAAARGIPNLGRPDSQFGNISRYESSGDSYYNGLLISVRARPRRWLEARLSYNYSKAIDDIGNFFFSSPQSNFNLRDDRGLSDNDQRHRLTVSGVLEAPRWLGGWQMAPLFEYTSPLPFNIQTGSDRNFDTNVNDRPVGVGRNTGRGFDFASLDVRVSRGFTINERFKVEALAECFNTLNRSNLTVPNNVIGTGVTPLPTFGRATAAFDPRQGQVGLRLRF